MSSQGDETTDAEEWPSSGSDAIDSLKDLTLEDGEISMMLPSNSDEASSESNIPMEYDYDMEDAELKNTTFPEAVEAPSEASGDGPPSSENEDLDLILNFLDSVAEPRPPSQPSLRESFLKARRKIDFDDSNEAKLKVSVRLQKLKEIRGKTIVTKSILAHRKQKLDESKSGASTSKCDGATPEWHSPPCILGDLCFICNSRKSKDD